MYIINWDFNLGVIICSDDKGVMWVFIDLFFKVGGNMFGCGMGERLVVDFVNFNIIYFGVCSGNGLWKSIDGGVIFFKVIFFINVGFYIVDFSDFYGYNGDKIGFIFVIFDLILSVRNGVILCIFVGIVDNIIVFVYVFDDVGVIWVLVVGQFMKYFFYKCKFQLIEKVLYFIYSDGVGLYDGIFGGVYCYDFIISIWKDIIFVFGGDFFYGFGGLGFDMKKFGMFVVVSLNFWWLDV